MKSKLTLVGAGPGDPDLITVKGVKAIESADVILYDALANDELLRYAKNDALKIFVGKRGGMPSFAQEKINQLIVSYASVYGHVVRLKGGDPFIFGRGKEEIDFVKSYGIEVVSIPGISSSTGITAAHGISLTERGIAHGVWVLTASLTGERFNTDIILAAQSNSTTVVLMGIRHLARITEEFKKQGKLSLPVMIVQNGSCKNEKILRTNVENMLRDTAEAQIKAPAIIVLGEVTRTSTFKDLQPVLIALN